MGWTLPSRRTGAIAAATAISVALALPALTAGGPAAAQTDPAIPDDGLPPVVIAASPVVSERTEILEAGVAGLWPTTYDSFPREQVHVLAIAEVGDTMYIGGKFTSVEFAAGGSADQSFLAAFDRTTGAWVDTFRPTLDGPVWDLKLLPDGRLAVGGQFTNVNGEPNTTAFAFLDPVTGAVDDERVGLRLTGSTRRPLVRAMDVEGDFLYLAGNFTRITGSSGAERQVIQISRLRLSDGRVDTSYRPNVGGIIFDVDADGDRVYFVGNFTLVNDEFHPGLGVTYASNGELVPNLEPFVRTNSRSYQQAILSRGHEVWQLGSEHNRQAYDAADYSLIRSWVSQPYGDGQAVTQLNGIVYTGSHAVNRGEPTWLYRDAITWPGLDGWTERKPIKYMGAFDTSIHEQMDWIPQIGSNGGEGSWELFADSTDCLWTGGDFTRGSFDGDVPRFVRGFAKFCAADRTPPEPPTSPVARAVGNGIDLSWAASPGDDRPGEVRYEILKNDGVFASFISTLSFLDLDGTPDDRYFVRAMDDAGNRSATTRVFTAAAGPDTSRPSTPTDLAATVTDQGGDGREDDVTLTWTPATDNIGVTEYLVYRNNAEIGRTPDPTFAITDVAQGDHWYQVRALDAAGNQGFKTPPILVTIVLPDVDVEAPSTPSDLTGVVNAAGDIELAWTASTDDVGVVEYIVYRNNVEIGRTPDTSSTYLDPPVGDSYLQVRAVDAAGNQGFKTPPTLVNVPADPGVDTTPPSTPQNLAGTQIGADVELTWDAATDDVGVTEYQVLRNGAEIGRVTEPTFLHIDAPAGTNWYQVRAYDAAGNESFKTSPLPFDVSAVPGVDTNPPSTPQNLQGSIDVGTSTATLTWEASTDDVGVTEYQVLRNGAEVARLDGATLTATVAASPGGNWYQIRAVDAAGNESFKTSPLQLDL